MLRWVALVIGLLISCQKSSKDSPNGAQSLPRLSLTDSPSQLSGSKECSEPSLEKFKKILFSKFAPVNTLSLRAACRCLKEQDSPSWIAKNVTKDAEEKLEQLLQKENDLMEDSSFSRCVAFMDPWLRRTQTDRLYLGGGSMHSCAVHPHRFLSCWGYNFSGQVGDGTQKPTLKSQVAVGLTQVVEVEGGDEFTCALKVDGTVWCWGGNFNGQLGNGSFEDRRTPSAVLGLSNVIQVSSAGSHSCALLDDGTVSCWGYNAYGQLGDHSFTQRSSPHPLKVAGITRAIQVEAGSRQSCALLVDGTVRCWGSNEWGQLGHTSFRKGLVPDPVENLGNVAAISSLHLYTCALLYNSKVSCWGLSFEKNAQGEDLQHRAPTVVKNVENALRLSVGSSHACILDKDHRAACWGRNYKGELGQSPDKTFESGLSTVSGVEQGDVIWAGVFRSCITRGPKGFCWGANSNGELGNLKQNDSLRPVEVHW